MKKFTLCFCIVTSFFSGCYTSVDTFESFGSAWKIATIEDTGNQIVFSPDGKYLLSTINENYEMFGSKDAKEAILWDGTTGEYIRNFELDRWQYLQSACFSPDGSKVAAAGVQHTAYGTLNNTISVWKTTTGQLLDQDNSFPEKVTTVGFSPDGQTIAATGWFDYIYFWNTANNSDYKVNIPDNQAPYVKKLTYNTDGTYLLLSPEFLMNVKEKSFIEIGRTGRSFSFLAGSDKLLSGGPDGINIFSYTSGDYFATLDDQTSNYLSSTAVTKDGKYFAGARETSSYGSKQINIWRTQDGAMIVSIPVDEIITALDFSPDGTRLAAADKDGNAHIFKIQY